MSTKFIAKKVPVLNFSKRRDSQGHVIPPECYAKIPEQVPVFYVSDDRMPIGWARVKRVGNKLVADMEIVSVMTPALKALDLIQKLYPGVVFLLIDAHEHVILGIELKAIFLGPIQNPDDKIKPLGDKVSCPTARTDLH